MAEIQWVVEVRCVNTTLANFKVGERGLHVCVHAPERQLDRYEFGKLVSGAVAALRIMQERQEASGQEAEPPEAAAAADLSVFKLGAVSRIDARHDLYSIQLVGSGQIILLDIQNAVMGPAEFDQFVRELIVIGARLGVTKVAPG